MMQSTMTALVWLAPGTQTIETVPMPSPGPGEVLVSVAMAGVCGSDVTAHKGKMGTARPGSIRGHEFAGTVGGQRVTVNPVLSCGACRACDSGWESRCEQLEIIGVHRPGAFAEFVVVPESALRPLPASVGWEAAAQTEPLAQARHDVVLAAQNGPLERVLVIGAGSIGGNVLRALRRSGAGEVVVADPDERRREATAALGASRTVTGAELEPQRSFDAVFDVVGVEATRRTAIGLARNGGIVMAVGLGADEATIGWFDLTRREVAIRGANCFNREDFDTALEWINVESTDAAGEASDARVLPLADGPRVFDELAAGAGGSKTFLAP